MTNKKEIKLALSSGKIFIGLGIDGGRATAEGHGNCSGDRIS